VTFFSHASDSLYTKRLRFVDNVALLHDTQALCSSFASLILMKAGIVMPIFSRFCSFFLAHFPFACPSPFSFVVMAYGSSHTSHRSSITLWPSLSHWIPPLHTSAQWYLFACLFFLVFFLSFSFSCFFAFPSSYPFPFSLFLVSRMTNPIPEVSPAQPCRFCRVFLLHIQLETLLYLSGHLFSFLAATCRLFAKPFKTRVSLLVKD
jgi:hypothetical protein